MKRLDPDRVRKWSPFLGLAALVLLSGCWTIPFPAEDVPEPVRQSSLEPLLGSTKEEVRERLGAPAFVLVGQDKSYFLYRGYGDQISVIFALYLPVGWLKEYGGTSLHCSVLEFGRDDVLERFETKSDAEWAYEGPATDCRSLFWSPKELAALNQQDPMKEVRSAYRAQLLQKAERGDPDAQYNMAQLVESGSAEQWTWYCRAATQGHAEAQFNVARHFERGSEQVSKDLVKAYLWYRAAETNGYQLKIYQKYTKTAEGGVSCCTPQTHLEFLAEQMSHEEFAQAERLAAAWEPDLAACVGEATVTSSSN